MKPSEELMALFRRLEGLGLGRAPVKDVQLSIPQFGLLLTVLRNPGIGVRGVAQFLGVSTPTVSVGLAKLEQDGWLRREADPLDKRAARLYLTAKAQLFAKRAQQFQRKHINEFMGGLDPREQQQLLTLLEKAIANLEQKHSSKKRLKAAEGVVRNV
jgi:DNA-binding MarR family transcriptional regulator